MRTKQGASKSLPNKLKTIHKSATTIGGVKNSHVHHPDRYKPEGKLIFRIERFSEFAREPAYAQRESDLTFIRGIQWKICAAKNKSAPDYMGIYLVCLPVNSKNTAWSCEASYIGKILHQQNGADNIFLQRREQPNIYTATGPGWGRNECKKFEELLRPENGWYDAVADTITIEVDMKAKMPRGFGLDMSEQWHRIAENCISKLLETETTSVCTIVSAFQPYPWPGISAKKFYANKNILITHSGVFRAMFTNENTKEFRESQVVIKDSTPTAIQQMLQFIIIFQVEIEWQFDFDLEDDDELLKLADKYQVEPLAVHSEEILMESISIDNVCYCLALADRHNAHSLKIACSQLIRENFAEVKKQEGWAALKESHPRMLLDIVEEMVK